MSKKSVCIITPTIGKDTLYQCHNSVLDQTYPTKHLIVVDGPEYIQSVFEIFDQKPVKLFLTDIGHDIFRLPENVGKDGWYGHRVYAAMPYLINEDLIIFLDEDNWIEPNHVEELVKVIEQGYDWSYTLRNIVDVDDNFICHDECESIGHYGAHIDTSAFCVPREILTRGISTGIYGKWGADRQFYNLLKHHYPKYECTNKFTLNYRLGGNDGSVKKEFFLEGNKQTKNFKFPWR